MVRTVEITLQTNGQTDIRDITGNVAQAVTAAGLKEGLVAVFTPSITSALTTIEFESGIVFLDFDNGPRHREVFVQLVGE